MNKRQVRLGIGLMLASLLLAACGTPEPTDIAAQTAPASSPVSTDSPQPIAPQLPPTPSSIPAPTATLIVAETEPVIEWDYVVLGDSRTGMGQWPRAYADHLENDLDLKVNLHNRASGGQDSDLLLADLQEDDKLRALVREAEVVTVWTGGERAYRAYSSKKVTCDRLLEAMDRDLGDIVAKVLALRGTNETIIHLIEDYHFQVEHQKKLDFFEDKKSCIEGVNAITHRVAAEYGIHVVPLYAAFNGPDGDQDPDGYLEDGIHTNATGDAIIADLLRELGYQPAAP